MANIPGFDTAKFESFFQVARPGELGSVQQVTLIAGGKSNLTYEVSDGERSLIVRRPPLGHVLATAHDMGREFRVMSALAGTGVPVPRMVVLCEDPEVLGEPFYVMSKVEGTPYRTAAQLTPLGPQRAAAISTRMVDTLVDLHQVDPGSVGLDDFGKPAGFLARQVRRWGTQLDASRSRDLRGADELREALTQSQPTESAAAIVHGDYRLDNLLIDSDDQVAAVVDWEMATLGDPLTDLALLVVYQELASWEEVAFAADISTTPGFLSTPAQIERYQQRSPLDLSNMGFYLGLAYFKLAVILEGIHFRFSQGQTAGEGFEALGAIVEPLLAHGLEAVTQ